jgi:hypothetical protein
MSTPPDSLEEPKKEPSASIEPPAKPRGFRERIETSAADAMQTLGQMFARPIARQAYFVVLAIATAWPLLSNAASMNSYRDAHPLIQYEEAARTSVVQFHQFPLWDPYYCGGIDGLGTPQSRFVSPTFLLTLIFGTLRGEALVAFFMFWLGLEGAFRYARSRGATHLGAGLAAPMFALSGFFAVATALGWCQFFGFELLPWAAWGLRRAIKGDRSGVVVCALALAWMVGFGGTYPAPMAALWCAFEVIEYLMKQVPEAPKKGSTTPPEKADWPKIRKSILMIVAAAALALGVAAVRLWPIAYTLAVAPRIIGGSPGNNPISILRALLLQIQPDEFGDFPIGGTFLVGGLGAVAVAASLTRKRAASMVIACTVAIWLAAGYAAKISLFALLKRIPVYQTLRYPERFLVLFALPACVLAAMGVAHLQAMARRKKWGPAVLALACFLLLANLGPLVANAHAATNGRPMVAPPRPGDNAPSDFMQARGTRWAIAYYPSMARGSLSCYDAYPVPQSPLLRGDLKADEYFKDPTSGSITRTSWTPNKIVLDVDAKKAGRVMVNTNWHVGWHSNLGTVVDDKGLLAIDVPEGHSPLTLTFLPREAVGGAVVTLASLAAMLYFSRKRARGSFPKPYEFALVIVAPLLPFAGTLAFVHEAKPPSVQLKTPAGDEMIVDAVPDTSQPVNVVFEGGVTLQGFRMSTARPTTESNLEIEFDWKVDPDVKPRMGIFVHLVPSKGDPGKDQIAADHVLLSDIVEFEQAPPNKTIRDIVNVTIPFDAGGKDWTVYVGIWNVRGNGKRRPVTDAGGSTVDDNRVELGKFTVP